MSDTNKSVGSEMVDRLRRFTDQLATAEKASDLPKMLTIRKVKLNLRPRTFSADEIKVVRANLNVSQAVLAEFLGVSAATVQDWEQGISEPNGPACRMMDEISRDVDTWAKRIRDLAQVTAGC